MEKNPPRALPADVGAEIAMDSWDEPALFRLIRDAGRVPEEEMRRTFNLGVGMILVVPQDHFGEALREPRPARPGLDDWPAPWLGWGCAS